MKMRYFWPPLATNNTLTCNGRNNKTNFLVTKLMSYSEDRIQIPFLLSRLSRNIK